MPRSRIASVAVAATVLLLAAAAGCTPDGNGGPSVTPTASPSASLPSATPTSTALTSTPPRPGEADVIALVKKYYAVDEAIALNSEVPVSRYDDVATGQWAKTIKAYRAAARLRGQRVIGKTGVSEPKITKLTPPSEPTVAGAQVCLDVRKVRAVDRQGHSIVPKGRPDFFLETLVLNRTGKGWRVSDIRNRGMSKC